MAAFPYVIVPTKLKSFLEEIRRLGIPETANSTWLKTIGYTSSNDLAISRVMEFIGFVDGSRKPTDKWGSFRDRDISGIVLAAAIKEGYSALYDVHPDAHLRSNDDLKNFFRTHTKAGENAVGRTANTFKTLCSLADFSEVGESEAVPEAPTSTGLAKKSPLQPPVSNQALTPSLRLDIHIHLSSDADRKQFDDLFASMAKILYDKDVEKEK